MGRAYAQGCIRTLHVQDQAEAETETEARIDAEAQARCGIPRETREPSQAKTEDPQGTCPARRVRAAVLGMPVQARR
jgi:hypothetical protein